MMRSLYSGVAGLKTHQTKMDVIGNNISNVNTVAFKSSTTTFQDLMYQTTQAASGATANKGGTNAKQIGLGVTNGATKVSITGAGAAQSTGDAFDIRLTDSKSTNFFIVSNGSENVFTRAGSFYIDGTGNLAMTTTGYLVMGWQVGENGTIVKDTVSALRVMQKDNMESAPEATTKATFSGVLDKNDTDVNSSNGYYKSLTFYSNKGEALTAKFAFKIKDPESGTYTVELVNILNSEGTDKLAQYLAKDSNNKISDIFGAYNAVNDSNGLNNNSQIVRYGNNTYLSVKMSNGDVYGVQMPPDAANIYDAAGGNQTTKISGFKMSKMTIDATTGEPTFDTNATENVLLTEIYNITAGELINGGIPLFGDDAAAWTNTNEKLETDTEDKYYFSTDFSTLYRSTDGYSYDVQFREDTGTFDFIGSRDSEPVGIKTMQLVNKLPKDRNPEDPDLSDALMDLKDIEIDFSNLLNYDNGGSSTVQLERGALDGTTGAGKKLGNMTGVSVDTSGKIWGSYDNGNTVLLGQIAVAQFSNASGLEEMGSNCYKATLNSGDFDGIGVDISADGSSMNTGQLEMSNVDLSAEFTDMIVTQRGFQANSRIITVSDTLLEELINLKR
ncbi:MAG: flagellar hook-basal body complex protein [Pseudobutyrivibrio sp.]|nr:flagellar hook-basal body complex protein [Pseudobutyrivibrio sp.]